MALVETETSMPSPEQIRNLRANIAFAYKQTSRLESIHYFENCIDIASNNDQKQISKNNCQMLKDCFCMVIFARLDPLKNVRVAAEKCYMKFIQKSPREFSNECKDSMSEKRYRNLMLFRDTRWIEQWTMVVDTKSMTLSQVLEFKMLLQNNGLNVNLKHKLAPIFRRMISETNVLVLLEGRINQSLRAAERKLIISIFSDAVESIQVHSNVSINQNDIRLYKECFKDLLNARFDQATNVSEYAIATVKLCVKKQPALFVQMYNTFTHKTPYQKSILIKEFKLAMQDLRSDGWHQAVHNNTISQDDIMEMRNLCNDVKCTMAFRESMRELCFCINPGNVTWLSFDGLTWDQSKTFAHGKDGLGKLIDWAFSNTQLILKSKATHITNYIINHPEFSTLRRRGPLGEKCFVFVNTFGFFKSFHPAIEAFMNEPNGPFAIENPDIL
jgi:hypothetical protein